MTELRDLNKTLANRGQPDHVLETASDLTKHCAADDQGIHFGVNSLSVMLQSKTIHKRKACANKIVYRTICLLY